MKRRLLVALFLGMMLLVVVCADGVADNTDLIGSWICCERRIPGCICVPSEGDWPAPPCPDGYVTVPGTTTYPAFCAVVVE